MDHAATQRGALEHPAIELIPPDALTAYPHNARTHSRRQIRQIADSIRRFGFTNPVLVAEDGTILAGHGRVAAARELGLAQVPVLRLAHLDETERRAYILADNRLALEAGWDRETLAIELQALIDADFEVELTGFSLAEIDFTLDAQRDARPGAPGLDDGVDAVPGSAPARPRPGSGTSGRLAATGWSAAMRASTRPSRGSSTARRSTWSSPIRPTTCGSTGMSGAPARSGTASSPWPRAG